jgi:hypothetical protein
MSFRATARQKVSGGAEYPPPEAHPERTLP